MVKWKIWDLIDAELDHIKRVFTRLLSKEVCSLGDIIQFISEAESILGEFFMIQDIVNYASSVPEELEKKVVALREVAQQLIKKVSKVKSV